MELKEKYCDLIDNDNGFDNELLANRCEQIAHDFAIGFAEWFVKTNAFLDYGYDEALQIYKKEKGL